MLFLLIYIFALIIFSFVKDGPPELNGIWATVSECMMTLLLDGVFLNAISDVARQLRDLNETAALVALLIFILITTITIMNMLIGVMCEVITEVTKEEKENLARSELRGTILQMLKRLDADGSGDISKEELMSVVKDPDAIAVFHDLEVDMPHFLHIQDMYYDEPGTSISISQIMHTILECRGDRPTLTQDIVNGHVFTRWNNKRLLYKQTTALKVHMEAQVDLLAQRVESLLGVHR